MELNPPSKRPPSTKRKKFANMMKGEGKNGVCTKAMSP